MNKETIKKKEEYNGIKMLLCMAVSIGVLTPSLLYTAMFVSELFLYKTFNLNFFLIGIIGMITFFVLFSNVFKLSDKIESE